jgi:hypothetical protein
MKKRPSAGALLMNAPGFLKALVFSWDAEAAQVLALFDDAKEVSRIMMDMLSDARETPTQTKAFFAALTQIVDRDHDVTRIVAESRDLLSDAQIPEVLHFHTKVLSFHPEMAVQCGHLLPALFELAFSNPTPARQEGIFGLVLAIARGGQQQHDQAVALFPDLTTVGIDEWGYSPPPSVENVAFHGLRNLGATCYFNSLFQQLYYSTPFRDLLIRATDLSGVSLALQHLFVEMALSSVSVVDPTAFTKVWREIVNPEWSPRMQEDA